MRLAPICLAILGATVVASTRGRRTNLQVASNATFPEGEDGEGAVVKPPLQKPVKGKAQPLPENAFTKWVRWRLLEELLRQAELEELMADLALLKDKAVRDAILDAVEEQEEKGLKKKAAGTLPADAGPQKYALFVLGASASGKSGLLDWAIDHAARENKWPEGLTYYQIDGGLLRDLIKMKDSTPNPEPVLIWKKWRDIVYKRAQELGGEFGEGASNLFEPAKEPEFYKADGYFKEHIGGMKKEIQARLSKKGVNVIIPDTGSDLDKTIQAYSKFKSKGYIISTVFIYADREQCMTRGAKRAVLEGKKYVSDSWGKAIILYKEFMKHIHDTSDAAGRRIKHFFVNNVFRENAQPGSWSPAPENRADFTLEHGLPWFELHFQSGLKMSELSEAQGQTLAEKIKDKRFTKPLAKGGPERAIFHAAPSQPGSGPAQKGVVDPNSTQGAVTLRPVTTPA